jgi:mannobiose 2-epimerase
MPARPLADAAPNRDGYVRLAAEVEAALRRDVLSAWFPRAVDEEHGGFHSTFGRDWKPGSSQGKFSVFQGRMTWLAAQVARRRPDLRAEFLKYARHGMSYLSAALWDEEHGGFYWGLDDEGRLSPYYGEGKYLYGISFCIYGAAAVAQAANDEKALALAQRGFRWADEHAHDTQHGGYLESLTRDGTPLHAGPAGARVAAAKVSYFPIGFKSLNTHLHLLESFTQLYEVWRDETLRRRVEELLAILRDRTFVEPGTMNSHFTRDWRAVPDHVSYGHDVEAAWLLVEAANVLGLSPDPRTERVARLLVDHVLAYGWDDTRGGIFCHGTTFGGPDNRQKEWWIQMEGLNALLVMHETYGRTTDVYFNALQRQWRFIKEHQIDSEFHGLFDAVAPDGTPVSAGKGRIWKEAHHEGRAFMNVSDRLRTLVDEGRG